MLVCRLGLIASQNGKRVDIHRSSKGGRNRSLGSADDGRSPVDKEIENLRAAYRISVAGTETQRDGAGELLFNESGKCRQDALFDDLNQKRKVSVTRAGPPACDNDHSHPGSENTSFRREVYTKLD